MTIFRTLAACTLSGALMASQIGPATAAPLPTNVAIMKSIVADRPAQARSLSGGNLQKFIVGREILQHPGLLVVSQPTWGVDAGAAAAIHQALLDLAEQGSAVLVISQDLDEIFALCDRIAVIAGGRLSEPRPVGAATVEEIGLLMGGGGMGGRGGDRNAHPA